MLSSITKRPHIFGVGLIVFCLVLQTQAKDLSEVQFYRRCYSQMTGEIPSFSDTRLVQIKAGTKTGLQACEDILDLMTIDNTDPQGKLKTPTDKVALKALNHIYNLARTWYKSRTLNRAITDFRFNFLMTEDLYDMTAPALVYTENIFNPSRDFKDIFTIEKEPRAKREYDSSANLSKWFLPNTQTPLKTGRSRYGVPGAVDIGNPETTPYKWGHTDPAIGDTPAVIQNFTNVEGGDLVGIHYNVAPEFLVPDATDAESLTPGIKTRFKITISHDVHATKGKGIWGLTPYLLMNTNWVENSARLPDNDFTYRRLSQNIIQDFLCRDLPVVRETDVFSMVSTSSTALAFRKASSCVSCHATMDRMAGVHRGLGIFWKGRQTLTSDIGKFAMYLNKITPTKTTDTSWPDVADADYYLRPPTGHFYFRTYDGKLIDKPLTGPDDLATEISKTEDAYICMASKVFYSMTGIQIKMFDTTDPRNSVYMQSLTPLDWKYRNFVVNAGKNLKSHQKVKTLIHDIIASPFYKKSDFGKSGGTNE